MWLVGRSAPKLTAANALLLPVQSALPLLSLYLTKLIVDAVVAVPLAPDRKAAFGHVILLLAMAGGVALLSAIAGSVAGLVTEAQGQAVTDHISELVHAKSVAVDLAHYETPEYYDTLHRAQSEAPFRSVSIVKGLAQLGQNGICLLAISGLLLSLHWMIAVILVVAVLPGILVRLKYSKKLYHWQRKRTPADRLSLYFHWLLTGDIHAKEIRLFGLGPLFIQRFSHLRQEFRRERWAIARTRAFAELATQAGAAAAVFASYSFITWRTVQGAITVGALVMYFQAFQRGQGFLRELLSSLAQLYEDRLFLTDFYRFLDLETKIVEPVTPKPLPRPLRQGIEFSQVTFQYPSTPRKALDGINLVIRPGEHIALVGKNGSGKTTLVKLLCRLYDPSDGVIRVDGVDLRELGISAWRREIGVIFQDYARYYATASENIWFGDVDLPLSHELIVAAAREAGADEVLSKLPRAYDTMLGKWFEDGQELSIGEWQKVALARAFLREAQLLVMDEPTSGLDAQAEYEVFRKFRQLAEGRMAILISHRFSTVKMADCIYVLEDGRIVESGVHDDLLRLGGTYAQLFHMQAQYYR